MEKRWQKMILAGVMIAIIPVTMAGYTMMVGCTRVRAADVASETMESMEYFLGRKI